MLFTEDLMKNVLADERLPQRTEQALSLSGYNVIRLPRSEDLPSPLASHADMLAFVAEGHLVTSEKYRRANAAFFEELEKTLPFKEFIYASTDFQKEYPKDAVMNALLIGKRLFCRKKSVSAAVTDLAERLGLRIVGVNQGYPACVTLPLGESAAITADDGMAAALSSEGIRVYKISNSAAISLPPYEYGFIGGAAGAVGDKIYFIGSLDAHPDSELIRQAVRKEGFTPVELPTDDGRLLDLGRLIFC